MHGGWRQPALRILIATVLSGAIVVGVALLGLTAAMADMLRNSPLVTADWPAPTPAQPGADTNVDVVLGTTGSVVTDALAPYEVFARSPKFHVYTVSAQRRPVPLTGGLPILPDYTYRDAPAPDVVAVPALADPAGPDEAPLRDWITAQYQRGAIILGVCAGSAVLAPTGILNGDRATSFWSRIDGLAADYPDVEWVRGERYVQDGRILTTAGVTSGVVGALRLVERLAGPAEAARIGTEVAYPQWTLDGGTGIPVRTVSVADAPYALNALFPWGRPSIGVGLVDGVGEIDVAAAFELYAGTSSAARAIPLANHQTARTAHGALLVPELAGSQRVDRFVVPGTEPPGAALTAWAADRNLPIDRPHQDRRTGEFSFDPVLRDLAAHADRATARTTAKYTEHLRLDGAPWPWRPTLLLALTLVLAVATGVAVVKKGPFLYKKR